MTYIGSNKAACDHLRLLWLLCFGLLVFDLIAVILFACVRLTNLLNRLRSADARWVHYCRALPARIDLVNLRLADLEPIHLLLYGHLIILLLVRPDKLLESSHDRGLIFNLLISRGSRLLLTFLHLLFLDLDLAGLIDIVILLVVFLLVLAV